MSDDELIQRAIAVRRTVGYDVYEPVTIFGASFNPTTLGHLQLMRMLLNDPILEDSPVYLIPARQSPLKSAQTYASIADRLEILNLAIDHHMNAVERRRLSIQTLEIDRAGPSRMSVTLALLTLHHQARQRYTLVCGYDLLASFTQWYQWTAFKDLATLMFYPREGISLLDSVNMITLQKLLQAGIQVIIASADRAQLVAGKAYCQNNIGDDIQRLQWVYNPHARIMPSRATDIRAYYQQHRDKRDIPIPLGITPEVHDYIVQCGCYR